MYILHADTKECNFFCRQAKVSDKIYTHTLKVLKQLKETVHVPSHVPNRSILCKDMAVQCQVAVTKVGQQAR
jgi:hypothetical protein